MKVHTICHMLVNGISPPPGTFKELPSNLGIKHTEKEKKITQNQGGRRKALQVTRTGAWGANK